MSAGMMRRTRAHWTARLLGAVAACVTALATSHAAPPDSRPPNIVLILADDLGYGDVGCFNPQSKIATPNLDRLAGEGMRFTDAHAPGAICIPSRYGLLTGRYPFRNTGNKRPEKGAMIEPGRATIATVLRERGYATAMIGKWHQGFDGGDQFDFAQPLRGGPVDHGFDTFFGLHASLDIPPYFLIENDRAIEPATADLAAGSTPGWSPIQGAFWREGKVAPTLKLPDMLPLCTRRAVDFLAERGAQKGQPFFLYLALTAPHTPWLPGEAFRGKSGAGIYGDFVAQLDDAVGQTLAALDRAGLAENTLVFFTSDNGPVWYPADTERLLHAAAGPWRGMKGDVWEGGHRMPFIARWPGHIASGSACAETISFTDFLATFAALSGGPPLPATAGEDSYNLLPLLRGEHRATPLREATVAASGSGVPTIRQGEWKLIPQLGSRGFSEPARIAPSPGGPTGQLYNLADDPGETRNLFLEHPEIAQRLAALLETLQRSPRTAPPASPHD